MKAGTALQIARKTLSEFNTDNVLRLSAALAYYAIFSIGPLLFILLALTGFIFGQDMVRHQIHAQMQEFVGPQAAKTVESMMEAPKISGEGLITTILGIITLVFGATGVFAEMEDALNTIWEIHPKAGHGLWAFIRNRFLSMSMVLGLGFLLLVSMVLTTAAEAVATSLGGMVSLPKAAMAVVSSLVSFAVVTLFFLLVFKVLPDVKVRWRPLWIGAVSSAILFTGGKFLLSLYLGRQATTSSYGAAGSVAVLLLWVYYSSLILYFGAEFTRVYATITHSILGFEKYAEPLTEEARAEQGIPHQRPQEG